MSRTIASGAEQLLRSGQCSSLPKTRIAEAAELARAAHDSFCQGVSAGHAKLARARAGRCGTIRAPGAYPGDWERSAKLLAENGFNMILPNMLWGGLAHYASDVLPRSATFKQYGDQIEQCCAAAKKHGLEVHVWKVNYNLGDGAEGFRREAPPRRPHAGDRQGRAVGLALPFASREPEAGTGEHVGGGPQVSGRWPALRLHPLSATASAAIATAAAAGSRPTAAGRLPTGRRTATRARERRSTTIGAAGRSRRWWRP